MRVLFTTLIAAAVIMTANSWPLEHEQLPAAYEYYLQQLMSDRNEEISNTFAAELQVNKNYGDSLQTQYTLPVESLTVVFRNPESGRVGLTLVTDNGDFVLRVALRVNYRGSTKALFINTRKNNVWGSIVPFRNFPFPTGSVSTTISMTVTVKDSKFVITANEIKIADFPYRGSLTYNKVAKILWGANEGTATKKSKLEKISISFP
ncbi:hypothetical protein GBAR_LOCUS2647 [Geodia barretti]|uniref:Galectin n=1 Tax=Geodia barretti TaxID=519541 RepID=A0AA35R123_GEOBA|nr:hypothetical protein GBAR_LOCUS2647 [Geodia barretti]